MKSLATFGKYLFIGSVSGYMYSWIDVAILRFFVSPSLIGAYEVAWRIASLSLLLTQAIRESLFPQISDWYETDKTDLIQDAIYKWTQPPLYITLPALAGAAVLGKDILSTFFSPEIVVAYPVLIIFMSEKILRSIHLIISPTLFAMDKPELGFRGSLAAIVTNTLLNLALIPYFGIIGAAVATSVSALIAALVNIFYISDYIKISLPWNRLSWSTLASGIMAISVSYLNSYTSSNIIGVIFGVLAGIIIYFIVLFLNPHIRGFFKTLVSDIEIRSQ